MYANYTITLSILYKSTVACLIHNFLVEFPVRIGKFDCLIEDDTTNFRLYLSAYLKQSYNSSKSANLAIYATIKEHIKFVKEKSECCVQGVMVGNCERCLSLSQYVTTAEANGYSVKFVGKITSDYTVNIDFKIVNILGQLNSLKTELEH